MKVNYTEMKCVLCKYKNMKTKNLETKKQETKKVLLKKLSKAAKSANSRVSNYSKGKRDKLGQFARQTIYNTNAPPL